MKKKCKYDKLLSSYIDEEMSPEDADRLGHHLKTCSLCSKEIESLR